MTGGPAVASATQVSIGGAEHTGGEWLGWRAGWDGGSIGGGQRALLPRCLVDKRLHSLFIEFDLALGVGVGWLGVWRIRRVLSLVWRRGRGVGRAWCSRWLLGSCTCVCWG